VNSGAVGEARSARRGSRRGRRRGNDRAEEDTFPKLLIKNARPPLGARTAMRHKDLGIWQSWTWAQMLDEVRAFSVGSGARAEARRQVRHHRGEPSAALLGDVRRPGARRRAGADLRDSVADEMAYVLEHAEVTVAVVENQEQVDKVLSIQDRLTTLRHMVYDEPRGLRDYDRANSPGSTTCRRSAARSSRIPAGWRAGRPRSRRARAPTSR
jgi:long-chain acyl-CoA synthetase